MRGVPGAGPGARCDVERVGDRGVVAVLDGKEDGPYKPGLAFGKAAGTSSCQRNWAGNMPRHCSSCNANWCIVMRLMPVPEVDE